jgi:hypothetical protein
MKRFRLALSALLLALPAASVQARDPQGPQRNLLIELRWVESNISADLVKGVREGAVIHATTGSVSPRGSVSLSTQGGEDRQDRIKRLLVLNNHSASVELGERSAVQWLDYALDLPLAASGAAAATARITAVPRTKPVEPSRSFSVTPHWPGGAQPVRVEFSLQELSSDAEGSREQSRFRLLSTVQLPLAQWAVVARSDGIVSASEAGVLRSSDARDVRTRELQMRVSLAP